MPKPLIVKHADRSSALAHFFTLICLVLGLAVAMSAAEAPRRTQLSLKTTDVLPTGNEWISLPTIRAEDGALTSFNVLSMRDRGLLEVAGANGMPVLQPYFTVDGKPLALRNLSWQLLEYWIPTATVEADGLIATITYCAPPGSRAALLRMTLTNRRPEKVPITAGVKASWGALSRVTYTPVELRGERRTAPAPWVDSGQVFSFVTDDTHFAWSLVYPGAKLAVTMPPESVSPNLNASRDQILDPGQTLEANIVIGVGIEEFSAAHSAKALRQIVDRNGADYVINEAAAWARKRTRTTGRADLDLLMNRNLLFTAAYAWGKTIDTEQFVGVTSRSPRYYVSAAYWDRDAMLWSFPGLLDIDKQFAREALNYALTVQLGNTGTHSRFIDGVVLEDGFQLDEAVAPIVALRQYLDATGDTEFVASHRSALAKLKDGMLSRFDPATGLYSTLQDSQDEYVKQPFVTYDNVLTWRAMLDLAAIYERMKDTAAARDMQQRADALRLAIMKHCVSAAAPGASGPIFVSATDGKAPAFADIPPGSLFKLPALGFMREDDPIFVRTYDWLHSRNYQYSYSDREFGLPGSYRLPFTTSWTVADHLSLTRGREQALKILRSSSWDGGIISEGVDPTTAVMDYNGRAFATAAGYVGHAICQQFCLKNQP